MKTLRILFLLAAIAITTSSFAQRTKANKLIGVWQRNTYEIADAALERYCFFKDGTFKYGFSQYDDRGRIKEASGVYKLNGNVLTIVIKARKELIGGDLIGGSQGFQSEELVLNGGKIIDVKQKDTSPIVFELKWIFKNGHKGFEIQNNKYYFTALEPVDGVFLN